MSVENTKWSEGRSAFADAHVVILPMVSYLFKRDFCYKDSLGITPQKSIYPS
jgi:hypothetical protein